MILISQKDRPSMPSSNPPRCPDRLFDPSDLVNSQVVHRDYVARLQRRREHLLDIGAEHGAGHGPVEHQGRDPARAAQARHDGRGLPMTRRRRIDQALAPGTPAREAGHRCGGSGLVNKDKALPTHVPLPPPPAAAVPGHVGPILLAGSQALFLCDRPSRCSMSAMVESAFTTIPRAASAALISQSVIPALLDTMARRSSAC